jgi:Ca-activated chloride channel family protein
MVARRTLRLVLAVALVAAGAALWALRPAGLAFADLWLTPDQQGRRQVERGDYAGAARHFRDQMWKGVACYRARDLDCAVQSFARVGAADGEYNLGVVQAEAGDLAASLAAFERALAARPGWRDAQENRDLVARIIAEAHAPTPDDAAGEPNDEPDDMKVDEQGKRGKRGTIEIEKLGPDAIDKLWLRNVRTDPAEFLRARFAAEARAPAPREPVR